jgi:hypothetical protein
VSELQLSFETIRVRLPSKDKAKPPEDFDVPWDALEWMLSRYDALVKERGVPGKSFMVWTELIAVQRAGMETDDPFDLYRPTRYKRVLRSVLRRRRNRRSK